MRDLRDLRLHNGDFIPFNAPRDDAADRLREAHGLLLLLQSAFQTSQELRHKRLSDEIGHVGDLNPAIMTSAIDGISTLVALAQHHIDVASAEQRANPAAVVAERGLA